MSRIKDFIINWNDMAEIYLEKKGYQILRGWMDEEYWDDEFQRSIIAKDGETVVCCQVRLTLTRSWEKEPSKEELYRAFKGLVIDYVDGLLDDEEPVCPESIRFDVLSISVMDDMERAIMQHMEDVFRIDNISITEKVA